MCEKNIYIFTSYSCICFSVNHNYTVYILLIFIVYATKNVYKVSFKMHISVIIQNLNFLTNLFFIINIFTLIMVLIITVIVITVFAKNVNMHLKELAIILKSTGRKVNLF